MLACVADGDSHNITWNADNFFFNMDNMIGVGTAHQTFFGDFFYHYRQALAHIEAIMLKADGILPTLKPAQTLGLNLFALILPSAPM